MLFFCLGVSAIFLAVVNAIAYARKGDGIGLATLCSLGMLVGLVSCLGSPVLSLNALLAAVAGGVCWWIRARPRWFLASSLAATAAAYLLVPLTDLWAWERLKKDYPLESLACRLAYEDQRLTPPSPTADTPNLPAVNHLASLEERAKKEGDFLDIMRTKSLERLHAGVVRQFIDSPGFGVGRMLRIPSPRYLEWERPLDRERQAMPSIPQPAPPYTPADLAPAPAHVASEADLLATHDDNTFGFLNPAGFGYIQDRQHVAGFRPHRFYESPRAPQRWHVDRLELVSLLKYDEPQVYLSANFPRMDELDQARTRPLDAFETEALAKLRRGEDLMVQETPRRMRMLGSIRAVRQCLDCHRGQGGELLGAFSYQLSPEGPPSK